MPRQRGWGRSQVLAMREMDLNQETSQWEAQLSERQKVECGGRVSWKVVGLWLSCFLQEPALPWLHLGAAARGPASSAGVSNAENGGHMEKGNSLEPGTTPVYVFQSFITFAT